MLRGVLACLGAFADHCSPQPLLRLTFFPPTYVSSMDITVNSVSSARTVLTLSGKVDHDGALQLEAALAPHLVGGRLALDLTDTVYVTSHGFRVLLSALRAQRGKGGDILLAGLSEPVRNYFEIAGLASVFEIVPTRADIRD